MPAIEGERPGHAMAVFRTLLTMEVEMGISPQGHVALGLLDESRWPAVKEVLDGAPLAFKDIVQEHCCEPWSGVDAPYVPETVRFNHRKKPNQMTWRTERGRLKQMVHRKRRGRWEWQRVR